MSLIRSSLVIDHVTTVAAGGGKEDSNLRALSILQCRSNLPTPPRTIYHRG
jgi:hypothetical protein